MVPQIIANDENSTLSARWKRPRWSAVMNTNRIKLQMMDLAMVPTR